MCGIVGVVGAENTMGVLLDGLSRLEYRGYDSAGVAVYENSVKIIKSKGKIENLKKKAGNLSIPAGCGIGHTRWATHGEPSEVNAHPHYSYRKKVCAVHNGIIENYKEIKDFLLEKGYKFYSDTDTEAAVNLIDHYLNEDPISAIISAMKRIKGSYALAIIIENKRDIIYLAKKDSPLIVGIDDGKSYIASDIPAILPYTDKVYYMDNMELARVGKGKVEFFDINGDPIEKELHKISWSIDEAELGEYDHFMLKEIYEQPASILNTLSRYIKEDTIDFNSAGIDKNILSKINKVRILGCGSAYHVGVVIQNVIEELCKMPVRTEYASEFRYGSSECSKDELVIVISQSGETADTLFALRLAKSQGAKTVAVVNVVGSSIAREAEHTLYTMAGPEIAVATTKAYTAQITVCMLLAIELARVKNSITEGAYSKMISEIKEIPDKISKILEENKKIEELSLKFKNLQHAFMIGRRMDYGICLEGSLKLKEISYIHSEAYPAGELKHGTISLIENGTIVIGVMTQDEIIEKTISNLTEVKSRGAYIIGITYEGNAMISDACDKIIYLPKTFKLLYPILSAIPLQLLAYYVSVGRGLNVDKPRNLAKSVTVE